MAGCWCIRNRIRRERKPSRQLLKAGIWGQKYENRNRNFSARIFLPFPSTTNSTLASERRMPACCCIRNRIRREGKPSRQLLKAGIWGQKYENRNRNFSARIFLPFPSTTNSTLASE